MARAIKEGDKVRIFINGDSWMSGLVCPPHDVWTLNYTPADVGDVWTFERDGQIIEIGSCSANFDGLELVERKEATNGS